jgi:hypothetical protein
LIAATGNPVGGIPLLAILRIDWLATNLPFSVQPAFICAAIDFPTKRDNKGPAHAGKSS